MLTKLHICPYRVHAIANTTAITSLTHNSYNLPIRGYFDIFRLQDVWDNSIEFSNLKIYYLGILEFPSLRSWWNGRHAILRG